MKTNKSILYCLQEREQRVKCNLRHNWKMLRQVVCQKDNSFTRVWEKHTSKPISCEGGCLYFDNYRTCFTICGHKGLPQLLYKLPPCQTTEKIEDCILCYSPVASLTASHQNYRPSMLALTANNHLMRYDAHTGKLLQQVYLTSRYKFRHIMWDDENQVVLRSTHSKMSSLARLAGIAQSLLMVMAVFTIFPLEFIAMMEITKDVFGPDITDAMISQGVLLVMHQGGTVRLYSWQHVIQQGLLKKAKLYENFSESSSPVGTFPDGLPLNVKLKERPPLLCEVKCAEHILSLGGYPWHYIITPPGSLGHFHVCSLDNKQLARNGSLDMGTMTVEPDKCIFHADDSGRILHIGASEVRVLKIRENVDGLPRFMLKEDFNITPHTGPINISSETSEFTYTSSGRKVRRVHSFDDELLDGVTESIQTVDYETDLDLLVVTAVHQHGDGVVGHVQLHDNNTGRLVQNIPLQEPWKEFCDHVVAMDMDTIVHIVRAPMRKFSCYVYKLKRHEEEVTSPSARVNTRSRRLTRALTSTNELVPTGRRIRRRSSRRGSDSDSEYVA